MKKLLLSLVVLGLFAVKAGAAPALDEFLKEGRIDEALVAYAQSANDADRFSLAVLQVLAGVRDFSTGFNRLSLHPALRNGPLPFFRAVVQDAPAGAPQPATPAAVAARFQDFRAALLRANATLAQITGQEEFAVPLNLSEARADFSGDGRIVPETETLEAAFGRNLGFGAAGGGPLIVRFDRADAAWLKGYTHLLAGMIDLLAAYDWSPVWAQCAHGLFLRPEPMPEIAKVQPPLPMFEAFPDFIAGLHEMRLELVDPEGPKRARDHFLAMIAQSRVCWQRVLQETDDVQEWLPNPAQKGPRGAQISREQIDAWQKVLEELEMVALGKKLLPHWRLRPGLGINVDRLVSAPPKLDLVLWLQGSALLPFVQEGAVSSGETWRGLTRPFGAGFASFAIWSN